MAAVFLSYSRVDRTLAEQVVKGLRAIGTDVWWDEDMPGVDWQEELARQIAELAVVIVLWTPASINSKNVRDEARLGQRTEKLVNVLAGVPAPPFPFDRSNGLPLDGWDGREPHHGWERLVQTIDERLARAGLIERGRLIDALRRRESAVRAQKLAAGAAEQAFADAKAEEDRTGSALVTATASMQAAHDELRRIVEMQAGATILHAAQAQLDAARAEQDAAAKERDEAGRRLAAAARRLTRAKAELARLFDAPTQGPEAPPVPPPGPAPPPAAARPPRPLDPQVATSPRRGGLALGVGVILAAGAAIVLLWIGPLHPAPPAPFPSPRLGFTLSPTATLNLVDDAVANGGMHGEVAYTVTGVTPGGAAEAAGLQVGDRILRINGAPISWKEPRLGSAVGPGQSIEVTFIRALQGPPQSLVIKTTPRP